MRWVPLALVVAVLCISFRGIPGVVGKAGHLSAKNQAIGDLYAYQN